METGGGERRAAVSDFISFCFFLGVERKLEQVLVCYSGDKNTEFIQTEEMLSVCFDNT